MSQRIADYTSREPKPCPEALPCPWCGQTPTIQPWHGGGPAKRLISCPGEEVGYEGCEVTPAVTGATAAKALAAWNSRA